MKIRSKAPLRIGLAGGGSDVSPYSNMYGGLVVNATIDLYAYCNIEETDTDYIELSATDINEYQRCEIASNLPIDGQLTLHKGVYNRLVKDFAIEPRSFKLVTYSDAPIGSGLGSSSTMVVALIKCFAEWYNLPLGEYEIAKLAYEIERIDLALSGGKQDQYAAAFGGFNFSEFLTNDMVIVNPLHLKRWFIDELESKLLLYYTGQSRHSAKIIDEQRSNTKEGNEQTISALDAVKQGAIDMKSALLTCDIHKFADVINRGWENKKRMASSISNDMIQEVMKTAIDAGAITGKVSGAGGGGFIVFVVEPENRISLINALKDFGGLTMNCRFSEGGPHGWKIWD